MLGIGLTDFITFTTGANLAGTAQLGISGWNKKLFWIVNDQITLTESGFSHRITAIEVNPYSNS